MHVCKLACFHAYMFACLHAYMFACLHASMPLARTLRPDGAALIDISVFASAVSLLGEQVLHAHASPAFRRQQTDFFRTVSRRVVDRQGGGAEGGGARWRDGTISGKALGVNRAIGLCSALQHSPQLAQLRLVATKYLTVFHHTHTVHCNATPTLANVVTPPPHLRML